MKAGDPSRRALALFYDSRVGTHREYVDLLGVKGVFDRLTKGRSGEATDVLLIDIASVEEMGKDQSLAAKEFI